MTPLLAPRVRSIDRAFERIYRRHVGDVYRYSLAVLRNPADAEDVTQTTFLNAYRAFERGERPEKPQNWLIAIAHNVCCQRFRQAARRPTEVVFNEDVAEAVPLDSESPTPADLTRALGHLAFSQRSALVLRELEGRSYAEIAQALHISVSAVETLLFRARRALREQLEGSLTCQEAELALSRQLDGRLSRADRGPLRAHLRECKECATFARSQRAHRAAWKGLAAIPLPSSLASFFGSGGAAGLGAGTAVGTGAATAGLGLGAKAAAVLTAAAVAGGVGYEGVKHSPWQKKTPPVAKAKKEPAVRQEISRRPLPARAPLVAAAVVQQAPPIATAVPATAARDLLHKRKKHKPKKDSNSADQQQTGLDERDGNRNHRGGNNQESGRFGSEGSARGKAKPEQRSPIDLAETDRRSKHKVKKADEPQAGRRGGEGNRGDRSNRGDESSGQSRSNKPESRGGNGNGEGGN